MFGFGSHERTEEEEKEAIKALRERLTDGKQPVEEQLREGGEVGCANGLDDVTLDRWLTAESYHSSKAESRLRKHAAWRHKEFPEGKVPESEVAKELKSGKVYLQGLDKFGRRVVLLKVNRHSRAVRDLKECIRLLCYSLDKAIALADDQRNPKQMITGIFDLRDLTMDNIDYHALKGVLDMLQEHYPERLGRLWMYEAPSIFWALWKAVSPFVDSVTKKKIEFVSGSSASARILEEISPEVLPKELGGEADFVRIQDFSSQSAGGGGGAAASGVPASNGTKSAIEEVKENGKLLRDPKNCQRMRFKP